MPVAGARVLVTRPAREAGRWVEALGAAGIDASPLPLIAIEPLATDDALRAARRHWRDMSALMFVSAAAVEHFFGGVPFDALPGAGAESDRPTRFWATGPGTALALVSAGVPPDRIDAPPPDAPRFDSEALWHLVQRSVGPGRQILIVRGGNRQGEATGRDWLQQRIAEAGADCRIVVAYRRLAPNLDVDQQRAARAASDGSAIWLFSSSEAIGNLRIAMPGIDWRQARALATHPRIAEAAEAGGFGRVRSVAPRLDALVASIESFE
ncbi:Uroporphyrinogen-III synthase [Burkholderiales bacterium 8X]|nr:Uroporphyrinogen-III synthase [Burkholderiales bacterium 8X]